jgi:hypothetical protein
VDEQQRHTGRRRSREEADGLAAEYEASGLTRDEFCRRRGVAVNTLGRYLTRLRRERKGAQKAPQWVAVEVAARSGDGGGCGELAVMVGGGRRIEVKPGFDADTLRRLVAALEGM